MTPEQSPSTFGLDPSAMSLSQSAPSVLSTSLMGRYVILKLLLSNAKRIDRTDDVDLTQIGVFTLYS